MILARLVFGHIFRGLFIIDMFDGSCGSCHKITNDHECSNREEDAPQPTRKASFVCTVMKLERLLDLSATKAKNLLCWHAQRLGEVATAILAKRPTHHFNAEVATTSLPSLSIFRLRHSAASQLLTAGPPTSSCMLGALFLPRPMPLDWKMY